MNWENNTVVTFLLWLVRSVMEWSCKYCTHVLGTYGHVKPTLQIKSFFFCSHTGLNLIETLILVKSFADANLHSSANCCQKLLKLLLVGDTERHTNKSFTRKKIQWTKKKEKKKKCESPQIWHRKKWLIWINRLTPWWWNLDSDLNEAC